MAKKRLLGLHLLFSLLAGIATGGCEQITPQEVAQELNRRAPTVQEAQNRSESTNTPVSPSITPTLILPTAIPTASQTATLTLIPSATPTPTLTNTATPTPINPEILLSELGYSRIGDFNEDGKVNTEDPVYFMRNLGWDPVLGERTTREFRDNGDSLSLNAYPITYGGGTIWLVDLGDCLYMPAIGGAPPTETPIPTPVPPTATPRPTDIPPTPIPRCDCNPDNIVIFYTGDLDASETRWIERLRQASSDIDINVYVIDHPDKVGSLPIEGVTDVVFLGHDTTLRKYDLGRFSGLRSRLTYMGTCHAVTFGNPAGSTGVMYATGDNLGAGGSLITYLSGLMKGTESSDLNGDGLINASELLDSYRKLSSIDSDGTETTIGAADNPSYIGPDICLLCAH